MDTPIAESALVGTPEGELSYPAQVLLERIRSLSIKTGYCHALQITLAGYIDKSVRSVQMYLNELIENGFLSIERRGNRNRYFPAPKAQTTRKEGANNAQKIAPDLRSTCASFAPSIISVHCASGTERAAAANPARAEESQEVREAVQLLGSLGACDQGIARLAQRHPKLAYPAARWFQRRLQDPKEPPIKRRRAFVLRLLQRPEAYGFEWDGEWTAPDAAKTTLDAQARSKKVEDAQKKRQADKASQEAQRSAYSWYDQWVAKWEALEESTRQEIRAEARRKFPLLVSQRDDSYTTMSTCLRILEDRARSG